jgi:hypothetical protein
MRKALICGLLLTGLLPAAAGASVAPLSREGRIIQDQRQGFETHARTSFGDNGLVEKLRDSRKTLGFIIVGKDGSKGAPRVLAKDEDGWYELRPRQSRRIPLQVGRELDRLLTSAAIWTEQPYNWGAACRGTPRLFIAAYAGRDQFGRLGCGPEGLAARAARLAETLQLRTTKRSILPSWQVPPVSGVSASQQANNADIFERLSQMTAAWERRNLAGFIDSYAEDVIVERHEGTLRGRKQLIEWAKRQQQWDAGYSQAPSRRVLWQMTMPAQPSNSVLYETHEIRWEENGIPKRQTFSTMWRNRAGLWQIAYERVSDVKPVTDRRPL